MLEKLFDDVIYKLGLSKRKDLVNLSSKYTKLTEKYKVLEKKFNEKKEEGNKDKKTIYAIMQIWKTMNSSEPLSKVLANIINGLAYDLGYLCCFLFKVDDNDSKRIKISIVSQCKFSPIIEKAFNKSFRDYGIPFDSQRNPLANSLRYQEMRNVQDISVLFADMEPHIDKSMLGSLDLLFLDKAICALPIMVHGKPYGCLVAISSKRHLDETDNNYLMLFAGQIELAVTMTGLLEKEKEQAATDPLTGLYNRRHFDKCLSAEIKRSLRTGRPFALVTFDLDHLKQINDTYGHSAGDAAICTIANVLLKNVRSVDTPARFGGEEFAVIMPDIDTKGGVNAAERLRCLIEERYVEGVGAITASLGVATFLKHANTVGELLELADQAMYRAKKNGRNRVEVATQYEDLNWQQLGLEIFLDVLSNRALPIDPRIAVELTRTIESGLTETDNLSNLLYRSLSALMKNYEPYYHSGIIKMKIELAERIAKEISLTKFETDKIKLAIIICDIGNIILPKEILQKQGVLDEKERKKVMEHPPLIAKEILKPIKREVINSLLSIVVHHHENWDGSGYPYKLKKEEIPIGARIICLLNAYTALISNRSYRKAYFESEAVEILKKNINIKWDGRLVNALVKNIRIPN